MTRPVLLISRSRAGPTRERSSLSEYPMGVMRGSVPMAAVASISCRLYTGTSSKSAEMTATSRSLQGPALPAAYEPNRRTESTRISRAIRSTKDATTRSSSASVAVARIGHVTSRSILTLSRGCKSLYPNIGLSRLGLSTFEETLRPSSRGHLVPWPSRPSCEFWGAAPASIRPRQPSVFSRQPAGSGKWTASVSRARDRRKQPPNQFHCSQATPPRPVSQAYRRSRRLKRATSHG